MNTLYCTLIICGINSPRKTY